MKILLVAVNAKYIHSNLAVYSLQAYAGEKGYTDIEIAEYTINQQSDFILSDIYERKAEIVCFSCYIWNIRYVEQIVTELGKLCPECPIWLGGPEVSYDAVRVLQRLPAIQGVMMGEGEETFAELCRIYTDGDWRTELENVRGISWRDSRGKIQVQEWRDPVCMSRIPFVYRQMKDFEHKIIYYESSRGCPFSCSYCLSSVDKRLRFRDTELVKKELQFLLDQQVPQVKFVDRTFNCSHSHAMEIWSYIAEHDNGITNFHFEISADLLKEEELELFRKLRPGLIQLEIGVQSTNPDTIREICRTMNFGKLSENVRRIGERNNIHQHLDLIAGLPYEDISSFFRSFDEVYRLKPHQLQLGFLKVLKGSRMEEKSADYGLVYQDTPPYEVLYTKWLSYEDVLKLKGIEEMVEIYYNSRQYENTVQGLEKYYNSPCRMYEEIWEYYRKNHLCGQQYKRSARYEILLDFIEEQTSAPREYFKELLTFDYYLRENAKTRPVFAGVNALPKETERAFYAKEETARKYLKDYGQYDKNQMRKMTHLEYFPELGRTVLFDYMCRNPVNQDARICEVDLLANRD